MKGRKGRPAPFLFGSKNQSYATQQLHRNLQETGKTVTGQTKKQIRNPTLKWMFFRFRGVREEEAVIVTNMTPELWKILRLLGNEYENYYL